MAGGAGGVVFELSFRRKIPCTVIDPLLPVKLNQSQRNTLKFRSHFLAQLQPGIPISHYSKVQHQSHHYQPPAPPLPTSSTTSTSSSTITYGSWKPSEWKGWFTNDFGTIDQNEKHLLEECTAIVGMHPDQATDAIIHVAMKHDKPWMICPCCVFPNTFVRKFRRRRRRRCFDEDEDEDDAEEEEEEDALCVVRSYDDFCDYIRDSIDPPHVHEVVLDFPGRNKVPFVGLCILAL